MEISNKNFDDGKPFDWGRTSENYAKYRDIYPEVFYRKIIDRGLCVKGQKVLDLGTGTGVLPRNMYQYGADWIGADISENQIYQARRLAKEKHMQIEFMAVPAEELEFPENTFDVVTACQCFWYFDHKKIMPAVSRMLKENGKLLVLYMAWLPFEDKIAGASEEVVLKYSPKWSGAKETRKPIRFPAVVHDYFELEDHEEYDVMVPFTKESWHGRMRACRGVEASLPPDVLEEWDAEHRNLLDKIAPDSFEVLHYATLAVLRPKFA